MTDTLTRYRASMTESQMLDGLRGQIVTAQRGLFAHVQKPERQTDARGLPDVIAIVPCGNGAHMLYGIEIKTRYDKRRPEQDEWIERLNGVIGVRGLVLRAGLPKADDELSYDIVLKMLEES